MCPPYYYIQLPPYGHLAITDTPLLRTGVEVPTNKTKVPVIVGIECMVHNGKECANDL